MLDQMILYLGAHPAVLGIGLFLVGVFPVIFWQAIKQLEPVEPAVRTGRPAPARAFYKRKTT